MLLATGSAFYRAVNDFIRPMAKRTGLDESEILRWVLTNIRPEVPVVKAAIIRRYPFQDQNHAASVEFLAMSSPTAAKFVQLVKAGQKEKALQMFDHLKTRPGIKGKAHPPSELSAEEEASLRSYAERPELISVTVTFKSQVTVRKLRDAYKKIRAALPKSTPPYLTRLKELVKAQGQPDKRWGQKWDDFRKQLLTEGYSGVPKTYIGLAQKYHGIKGTRK